MSSTRHLVEESLTELWSCFPTKDIQSGTLPDVSQSVPIHASKCAMLL
jgi:hypothetical protein